MNALWRAEAKANRTLGVRLGGWRHPQAGQPQRQVVRDFPTPVPGGHAVGIKRVLHAHGGQSPVSNGFAHSAKRALETTFRKLRVFAERAYPRADFRGEKKCT